MMRIWTIAIVIFTQLNLGNHLFAQNQVPPSSPIHQGDTALSVEEELVEEEYDKEAEEKFYFEFKETQNWPSYNRKISDGFWREVTNDKAFNYKKDNEAAQKTARENSYLLGNIIEFLMTTLGQVILWLLVALLVGIIIYRLIRNNGLGLFQKADKKTGEDIVDEHHDAYIPDDWEKSIKAAAEEGNFRLAIRLSFRWALARLAEKEKISFQPSKTNYQYAYEIKDLPLRRTFMDVLHHYEYAWYGGFQVQERQYDRFKSAYQKLNDAI